MPSDGLCDALVGVSRGPVEELFGAVGVGEQVLGRRAEDREVRWERPVGAADEVEFGGRGVQDLFDPRTHSRGGAFAQVERLSVGGAGVERGEHGGGDVLDVRAAPQQVAGPTGMRRRPARTRRSTRPSRV